MPILVLRTNDASTPYEQAILDKATSLGKENSMEVLSIDPDSLFMDERPKVLTEFKQQRAKLVPYKGFLVEDSCSVLFHDDSEQMASDTSFRGEGSYNSIKKGTRLYANLPLTAYRQNTKYHFSMWMYNGEPDALNDWFRLILEEQDPQGMQVHRTTIHPDLSGVINGKWSLVEREFIILEFKDRVIVLN